MRLTKEERIALASCVGYLLEEDHDYPYDDWLEGRIFGGEGRDETLRPTLDSAVAKLVDGGTQGPPAGRLMATREERFDDAMRNLVRQVDAWHDRLHDPYKPPELRVGLPPGVTAAAWEVGIAWHLLTEEPVS
jgi:hypothetical protein